MAGRPSKPVSVIESEGKSHRTKAELEVRKQAEQELLTGESMQEYPEVKENEIAHKEFIRLKRLLAKIGKSDALHEGVINRYALLRAECADFERKRESFYERLRELEQSYHSLKGTPSEISVSEYFSLQEKMQKNIISVDKQVQSKRAMMLQIEKENLLTIASALRSIPKTPSSDKQDDPMAELLKNRQPQLLPKRGDTG